MIVGGLVPVLPSCLFESLWDQLAALLPEHVDTRPLGCHNPRIPDLIVFERVIAALVHGSGYERIADRRCSDRTIRRRVKYGAQLGMAEQVNGPAVQAYDRMIGLQLRELSVDGWITKAPCGGERAGRSPVDRGKQGLKRSVATEARGVPTGLVPAGPNRHGSPLLVPTLEAAKKQVGVFPEQVDVNVDRGYDSDKTTRAALEEPGFTGEIARKGVPAPIQAGKRWVVERSHAWMNGFGKVRRCTEKRQCAVDFCLCLSAAIVTLRMLIRRAIPLCRWDGRPTTKRLE